jgi:O-antigen/teichoic acid export membrane protein
MDAAFLKYKSVSEFSEEKKVFSTPYIFVTITTLVFSLIILLLKVPLSDGMSVPFQYSYLLNYVVLILIFDTLALVPFSNLRLQRKAAKFAVIKTLNILINLGLNIYLIIVLDYGIEGIFISNTIASAFSFVALLPEIIKYFIPKIDFDLLKKMLKFGIPYLPASIAATIVQVIDRPILVRLAGESALGIYQANYKLGIFMMLFVQMFQYAWQPFFLNNAKDENAKRLFSKILTIYVIASSLILVILSLFISDFAKIEIYGGRTIIGQEFLSGLYIVPVVLLAYVFHGMYVNFQAGIYIEEKTKYFPLVTGAGALINIVVNILLIPQIGIMGAAVATLASYFVMASGLFIVARKFYKIEYEFLKIGTIFLLVAAAGFVFYYIFGFEEVGIINKLLILLGFVSGLFIFRVVSKEEISSLKKLF